MKYTKALLLSTAATMLAYATPSFAYNITINDSQTDNSYQWGADGRGRGGEDQETEPATVGNQSWDLEAFTLKGTKLGIYSGFNLLAGFENESLGDIFIGKDGITKWKASDYSSTDQTANLVQNNASFKYDYVIHFNDRKQGSSAISGSYDVYKLTYSESVKLDSVNFDGLSNVWKLSDRNELKSIASGVMNVVEDNTSTLTLEDGSTVTGGKHYIGSLDLGSFLTGGDLTPSTLFHLTLSCGNDNLIGRVPDGGTTMALLGMAVSGMSFFSRRKQRLS